MPSSTGVSTLGENPKRGQQPPFWSPEGVGIPKGRGPCERSFPLGRVFGHFLHAQKATRVRVGNPEMATLYNLKHKRSIFRPERKRSHCFKNKKETPIPRLSRDESNSASWCHPSSKKRSLFLCVFFAAGRGPRAFPPPLGRCLPTVFRRGLQPKAPFSVPAECSGTPAPSVR